MGFIAEHYREQHPVGQGLFHSANITVDGEAFWYVYDCGAMHEGNRGADEASAFAAKLRRRNIALDAIFVSHFHEDHINALPELLSATKGIDTRRLFMPLLDSTERILRVLGMSEQAQDLPLVKEYAVLGAAGFENALGLAEGSVVEVFATGGENRTPEHEIDSSFGPDGIPWDGEPGDGQALQVGITAGSESSSSAATGLPRSKHFDDQGIFIAYNSRPFWEFRLHVDSRVSRNKAAFLQLLEDDPRFSKELTHGESVDKWLQNADNVRRLFDESSLRRAVREAYRAIKPDLNLTSMSLYSGPHEHVDALQRNSHRDLRYQWRVSDRVSWLGTGDARLRSKNDVRDFLQHYTSPRLGRVKTLVIPHHGSWKNFGGPLAAELQGALAVFSYGLLNPYRHPAASSLNSARSASMPEVRVTEARLSRLVEVFWIVF